MRNIIKMVCFPALLSSAGCAYIDKNICLDYKERSVPHRATYHSIKVSMGEFGYGRNREIGCVRDIFGLESAKVRASNDLGEWLKNAVAEELKGAGCEIVESGEPKVFGSVEYLYIDMKERYKTEIAVRIGINDLGSQRYINFAEESVETSGKFGFDSEYRFAANIALREVLSEKVVPDVVDYLEVFYKLKTPGLRRELEGQKEMLARTEP